MPIKFGTDGWRAIMGDEYTIDNVMLCAQATANLMKSQGVAKNGVIIGFDTRFGSEKFAAATAEVMAANNIRTMLCDRPVPTPVVSYNVKKRGAGAGVVITASHNPAEWNGFKFKPHYGGSATPDLISLLESQISSLEVDRKVKNIPLEEACREGIVNLFDAGIKTTKSGRIRMAINRIDAKTLCVTYGDGIGDIDVNSVIDFHRAHGCIATVTGYRPLSQYGVLDIDDRGRVFSMNEKPRLDHWINAGFFVFERSVLEYLGDDDKADLETAVMPKLASEGELMMYKHEGFWEGMDTLRDKEYLEKLWTEGSAPWQVWE